MEMRKIYKEELLRAKEWFETTPRELMFIRRQQMSILLQAIGQAIVLDGIPFLAKEAVIAVEKVSFSKTETIKLIDGLIDKL